MHDRIGKMIYKLRKEAGISQWDLARGIVSKTELSRIERGEKEIDRFTMEALFQRIGKSADKLEQMLSSQEYQHILSRNQMLCYLLAGKTAETKQVLEEYKQILIKDKQWDLPLYYQAWLQFYAVCYYIKSRNPEKSIELLKQALAVTYPKWENMAYEKANFSRKVYLCVQEIQLILMILYIAFCGKYLWIPDNKEKYIAILEKLMVYIDKQYTDGEERAKVFPQCVWLWGKICLSQGNAGTAYEVCRKGIDCLAENGSLSMLYHLLELEEECQKKLGKENLLHKVKEQKAAVKFLYDIAENVMPSERIAEFLFVSRQSEILVANELLKEVRLEQNLSQEELSTDICTQETLSRIECGKRRPHSKNLYGMLRKMGVERERVYGFIISDDYELYEKVRWYKRKISKGEMDAAKVLLDELENALDMDNIVNRQFIETAKLQEKLRQKNADYKWGLTELKRILNYTLKGYNGNVYRVPFRQEVVILNQMAVCLYMIGEKEDALEIYRQIFNRYDTSIVSNDSHIVPCLLLYVNYAGFLENVGYLDKAQQVGVEGLEVILQCQRGDCASEILANMSCIYERRKKKKDEELAEKCLRYSYFLTEFYKNNQNKRIIGDAYKEKYFDILD